MRGVLRRPAESALAAETPDAGDGDRARLRAPAASTAAARTDGSTELVAAASRRWSTTFVRTLIGLDLTCAALAVAIGAFVRFGEDLTATYMVVTVAFPFTWLLACTSTRSYEKRFLGTGSEEFRRVFDAGVRMLALVALVSYAFQLSLARLYVLIAIPLTVALTLVLRYAARQVLHRLRGEGRCLHRVVVVGRERSCAELIQQLHREIYAGFSVVGACINAPACKTVEGVPVLGGSSEILAALRLTGADTVAVGPWSDLSQSDLRRLSWELEGTGIALVVAPSLTDVAGPRIHIRPVAGLPLLHIEEPEFGGARRALKSTVDRLSALLLLLAISPLLLLLAIAVRLDSRGPALFRQERVGADERTFTMYKLRTMHVGSEVLLGELKARNEAADGVLFKIRADPRVTRVGRTLRRFSLDELPQLLNILRGDMSVVGPRPPLPHEVEKYALEVHRRLLVRPGLTGLWQISGRSNLSWDESVRLDLHYVENWSLALDVLIVWKTLGAVLHRRGAY